MPRRSSRRRRLLLSLSATGWLSAPPLLAQTFPSRPITLIVGFPPGGATDRHLRQFAELASPWLGQPVVVDNRPGAAGALGPGQMAMTARPDGYTVSHYQSSVLRVALMQKTAWHPLNDFSFLIGLAGYRQSLLVRADSPHQTLQGLLRAAQQGSLDYGTTGVGSGAHALMEQLTHAAGVKMVHVPFKGSGELLQALLGGHVHAVCDVTGYEPLVDEGRLRLLVNFGDRPSRRFPQVPTARSLGFTLASELRYGLAAPRDLDPAVLKRLHDAFRQAALDPRHEVALEQANLDGWLRDSDGFRAWAVATYDKERELLSRLGLLAR